MGKPSKHASSPSFVGLAKVVQGIVVTLTNITGIRCVDVRACHGQPKIKVREIWSQRYVEVIVSDREHGQRELNVFTSKPAAIARILTKELRMRGMPIVDEKVHHV